MELIVTEFVSLDGVMEAPGGEPGYAHSGWVADFFDDAVGEYKLQECLDSEACLLGRVTYESFAGAWPTREDPFADHINRQPKYVASTTMASAEWENTTVLQGDVPTAVADLRARDGGVLLVPGSRTLVHTLLEHGLVDELRTMIFPVILGSGRRLYPDTTDTIPLELTHHQAFPTGVVVQHYRPR